MNLDRLEELKQKLSQEKELSVVWTFYMDHFADHQEFIEVGGPTSNSLVTTVVAQVAQQMFGRKGTVSNLLLIRIPDYRFIHGPFMVEGRTGGVIYFEDTKMGLVAVAEHPPSQEVKYARFSGQPMKRQSKAWLN